MRYGNEAFASDVIIKLPQLVPIMRDIEEVEFHDERSKLAKLVLHMFENTLRTNVYLNRVIGYALFNCIEKTRELKRGFILLFNEGLLSPAFTLNRSIFENWGAACFIERNVREFRKTKNETKFSKIADKLFSGARYPVKLPWGEPSTETPVRVGEMITELERCYPGTGNTYSFLCEYCHPNFLYNMEAYLASNQEGLWDNPLFSERITIALEKQLLSLAQAVLGIKASTKAISDMCLEEYGVEYP